MMTKTITVTCDWCGKVHTGSSVPAHWERRVVANLTASISKDFCCGAHRNLYLKTETEVTTGLQKAFTTAMNERIRDFRSKITESIQGS